MKYGIWLPYSDVRMVTRLAQLAENCGWHGIFFHEPHRGLDSWVSLAAAAMRTEKIRIGGLIASTSHDDEDRILNEALKIDHHSNQRLIICTGPKVVRARPPVPNASENRPEAFQHKDAPIRGPDSASRPTIWRVGLWPELNSMKLAVQSQGLIPVISLGSTTWRSPTLEEIRGIVDFIRRQRGTISGFDIVLDGGEFSRTGGTAPDRMTAWELAGATWWIVRSGFDRRVSVNLERLERILVQGPPQ